MKSSPMFSFFVVLLIAVSFVLVVALMESNRPTAAEYYNNTSTINVTQGYIDTTTQQAPNWVLPAVLLCAGFALMAAIFTLRR